MDEGGLLPREDRGRKLSRWLTLTVLAGLIALLLRQPLLVLLTLALALALAVAWLWRRYGLRGVRYRRTFSQDRAMHGEEVTLELIVENAKLLPLPWLEVED